MTLLAGLGLLRSPVRAALCASLWLVLFYTYGYAYEGVADAGWLRRSTADRVLLPVFSAAALGAAVICWRARGDLRMPTTLAGAMAVAMIVLSLGQLAIFRTSTASPARWEEGALEAMTPTRVGPPAPPATHNEHMPDIYYIVLDGYAGSDVLDRFYHHDNADFEWQLRRRGFYIARKSRSNYARTHLSMASSLNSIYLDPLADLLGRDSLSHAASHWLIKNNWAGRFLRSKGYRYAQIYTNWAGTESSDIADMDFAYAPRWMGSEFAFLLLGTTPLHGLRPDLAGFHHFGFQTIAEVADAPGPTFLLAHLLLPHNPYIFDRQGNVRMDVPLHLRKNTGVKKALSGGRAGSDYINQLVFLNGVILEIVDEILARSEVPPVIILQGDHGWSQTDYLVRSQAEFRTFKRRARMSILNAYLVPGQIGKKLYPEITPVNTFRLIFSHLFDAELELLPDRCYYSTREFPFTWSDVTSEVR